MSSAFLDTSAAVSLLMRQGPFSEVKKILSQHQQWHAAKLLTSELYSVLTREGVEFELADPLLKVIGFLNPDDLKPQVLEVLSKGYLRGADTHHLASALWLAGPHRQEISFFSLDVAQAARAAELGFSVPAFV